MARWETVRLRVPGVERVGVTPPAVRISSVSTLRVSCGDTASIQPREMVDGR